MLGPGDEDPVLQQLLLQVQAEAMMDMGGSVEPSQTCPHVLERVAVRPHDLVVSMNRPCERCDSHDENSVCLGCNATRCSRYVMGHMAAHCDNEAPDHCVVLSLSDLSVWCYACNTYIKHDSLMPLLVRAEAVKFSTDEKAGLLAGVQTTFDTCVAYAEDATEAHERRTPPCFERPARTRTIWTHLKESSLLAKTRPVHVTPATEDELRLVHTPEYVSWLASLKDPQVRSTLPADLYANEATFGAVCASLGSAVCVVRDMKHGHVQRGLALTRPPGHHAGPSYGGGFCFANNAAVAARVAQSELGVERVMILDWDIHHGNGTQDIFYHDPSVLVVSIHRQVQVAPTSQGQPSTESSSNAAVECGDSGRADRVGVGAGVRYNVNIPLHTHAGVGDASYMHMMRTVVCPVASEFKPQLVIISAGFDAGACDEHLPVGGYRVTPECFAHMTHMAMQWGEGSKVLMCLEGLYNLAGLASCVDACMRVLLGAPPPPLATSSSASGVQPQTLKDVEAVVKAQVQYWPCLRGRMEPS